ncbi:MAG: SH3 domain-containing protein [Deltaproteobacteria bacterium]|nr:SH3 domain-containing protein [Deltaproteobacteria bacterium]MBW2018310.1 SH3 domain-containing protein [Deltaproteobacteria bacterium]
MKKKFRSIMLILLVSITTTYSMAASSKDYYVSSNKLNVRLAPNKNGKITNTLYKGQKVEVFEIKNGWARISRYYDGRREGVSGKVARWVFAKYLSVNRIADNKTINNNSPIAMAIKSSDDFAKYQSVFINASERLIRSGQCTLEDFKEMGGWVRSTKHKPNPVYFTYCGGMNKSNRIYLNAATGKIFR